MKPRIFVVQPVPQPAIDILREVADVEVYPYSDRQITVDELCSAVRRNDYVFAMHETIITAEVIAANPELRGIAVGGRDYEDMIDVAACAAAGVPIITHTVGRDEQRAGNAKATADLTTAMVLACAYRLVEADTYTRGGGFRQEMTMDLMGVGCTAKVAGVVGMGRVARELVGRLQALDMDVVYTKRSRLPLDEEAAMGIRWVGSLDELLPISDYVVMLADYNASTHKLMGAREFGLMKPTASFINTGRGRLVDELALIEALTNGTIASAGLDVYWNEPPETPDPFVPHALRRLPNVVLTPHNGGATWDSRGRQTAGIARSIVDDIAARAVPAVSAMSLVGASEIVERG
jgi:glyoxylate reductase